MKQTQSVLLAFLVGAVAGAAVALLFAPESGEQTRQRIKQFADQEQDRIKGVVEALSKKKNG